MDVRTVYFLLHVPKCAGSTIIAHLERHLGSRAMRAPRPSGIGRELFGDRYPFGADDPRLREVVVFHGHGLSASLQGLLPGVRVREAVLLRDPLGWFVSKYNYRVRREREGIGPRVPPFDDWYGAQRRNPIARFLLDRYFGHAAPGIYRLSSRGQLRTLEAGLARFWFVGSFRAVGELAERIAAETGVPGSAPTQNVDPVRAVTVDSLPEAFRRRIVAENPVDALLYERWKDRRFDSGANPPPLTAGLSGADHAAILLREADIALRRAWLRHARGFERPVRRPAAAGQG
jgi:hypothetical protein